MTRVFRAIRLAVSFLSVIPIRIAKVSPTALTATRFAYPVIGFGLGLILAGVIDATRGRDAGGAMILAGVIGTVSGSGRWLRRIGGGTGDILGASVE